MSRPEGRHINKLHALEYDGGGLLELHCGGGEGPTVLVLPIYLWLELHWLLCGAIADMQGVQDNVRHGGRKRWMIGGEAYPSVEHWAPQPDPGPGRCVVPNER